MIYLHGRYKLPALWLATIFWPSFSRPQKLAINFWIQDMCGLTRRHLSPHKWWFRSYRDSIAPSGVLRLATLGVELLWHGYWHQPWSCPSKRFTWWFLIVKSQQNVTELVTRLEQRRVRALRELSAFWSQPSHRWPNGGGIRMHGRNSLHYTALQKDKRQLPTDKRDHVGGAGGICGSISGSDKKQAFDKIEKRRHFIHTWLPFHSVNAGIRTFLTGD